MFKGLIRKKAKATSFKNAAFIYAGNDLRSHTHTFACSTIGPAGLNFRARDGNAAS